MTIAIPSASTPAKTAIKAAKGFIPSLAMSTNLTFDPTPAKEMTSRNGISDAFSDCLRNIHIKSRNGRAGA